MEQPGISMAHPATSATESRSLEGFLDCIGFPMISRHHRMVYLFASVDSEVSHCKFPENANPPLKWRNSPRYEIKYTALREGSHKLFVKAWLSNCVGPLCEEDRWSSISTGSKTLRDGCWSSRLMISHWWNSTWFHLQLHLSHILALKFPFTHIHIYIYM